MTSQGWLQIGLTLLIGLLISIPVGRYLAWVTTGRKTPFDRLFDPIDNGIYLLIGRRICGQAMDWKAYTLHMLATNLYHGRDHFPDPGVPGSSAAEYPALRRHGAACSPSTRR